MRLNRILLLKHNQNLQIEMIIDSRRVKTSQTYWNTWDRKIRDCIGYMNRLRRHRLNFRKPEDKAYVTKKKELMITGEKDSLQFRSSSSLHQDCRGLDMARMDIQRKKN